MDNKKLTLNDFIAKAKQKEQDKFKAKAVFIESLEGEVMLQKIPINNVLVAIDRITTDDSMQNIIDVYKQLIYDSIPMLKAKELQEQFNLAEPFDIVLELFELNEITKLGEEIQSLYGLDKLEDTVKN